MFKTIRSHSVAGSEINRFWGLVTPPKAVLSVADTNAAFPPSGLGGSGHVQASRPKATAIVFRRFTNSQPPAEQSTGWQVRAWSQLQSFENMHGKDLMEAYHFVEVGTISAPHPNTFKIELTLTDALQWEKAVYVFLFNEEIVRIGSSKGKLGTRMKQWSKDVTNALLRINGLPHKHTNTPDWEAREWHQALQMHKLGVIYAREAHLVTTPIGSFRAYMDEESVLINRYKPKFNRHSNR